MSEDEMLGISGRTPVGGGGKLNQNIRLQVRVRTTQTAGANPPDSAWNIISQYDSGPIPQPLIINNINVPTPVNQAETIMFAAQDPNPGATITFSIVTQPKNGTLSNVTNNEVTYTPKQDFQGIDSFTYQAQDQTGLTSQPAVVSITVGTPPANVLGTMNVINHSTQVTDAQVQQWVTDIQTQVNNDVAKAWNATVNLVWIPNTQTPPTGNWVAGIFDTADQPGALGYHEVGPNGEPLAKIFVTVSKQAGVDVATVLSHEVIESIGDPQTNTIIQNCKDKNGRNCTMFQELCDAVENDLYQTGQTNVSNFITPDWFKSGSQAPYDQLNKTTQPFQLTSGGYSEVSYDGGRTWTSETQARGAFAEYRRLIEEQGHGRHLLYKKNVEARKRSSFAQS